jgi:hypothetical protein
LLLALHIEPHIFVAELIGGLVLIVISTASAALKKTDAFRKAIKRSIGVLLFEHRDVIPPPRPCNGGHG